MPITRTPMVDDDGSGTTGTIINNAWKTELYGQIDADPLWIAVPFAASTYQGNGPMVWTIGAPAVIQNRYARKGNILYWNLYISWFSGSNVLSGSPASKLVILLPGGAIADSEQRMTIAYSPGVAGIQVTNGLQINLSDGLPYVVLQKPDNANFALADVPGMLFTITFGVR